MWCYKTHYALADLGWPITLMALEHALTDHGWPIALVELEESTPSQITGGQLRLWHQKKQRPHRPLVANRACGIEETTPSQISSDQSPRIEMLPLSMATMLIIFTFKYDIIIYYALFAQCALFVQKISPSQNSACGLYAQSYTLGSEVESCEV